MSSYKQLTREERYQIHALLQAGHEKAEIALQLGRDRSTIYREVKRNRGMSYLILAYIVKLPLLGEVLAKQTVGIQPQGASSCSRVVRTP
jgi:hypothetical protein